MRTAAPRFGPCRPLGRTGFVATRLGAGDLADRQVPIDTCVRTLVRALDAGLQGPVLVEPRTRAALKPLA